MSGPELGSQERVWTASGGSRLAGTELTAPALLVDFGSTFTKVTAVDTRSGALVGSAQYRTTVESDLMDGFSAGLRQLRASGMVAAGDGVVLGCSSAGGGLRVAIVGLERDLTAEAAKQVALNSGGRIVAILTRGAGESLLPAVQQSAADLVLLVGGTDGGDEEFAVWAARSLAVGGIDCPVVFAGNTSARARVAAALDSGSITWRAAPNVLPEIGRAEVDGVQSVIREAFIEHVIKGKRLSASDRFGEIVALPTPDAVLEAVKLVARGYAKLVAPASRGERLALERFSSSMSAARRPTSIPACPPGMPRPAGPARWSPQRRWPGLSRPTWGSAGALRAWSPPRVSAGWSPVTRRTGWRALRGRGRPIRGSSRRRRRRCGTTWPWPGWPSCSRSRGTPAGTG